MKKYLIIVLALIFSINSFSQCDFIERMEPPFWWKNMNKPELQIMFYGENIAEYKVEIENKNIDLLRTELTNNSNYLFIYITIDEKFSEDAFKINFLKNNKIASSIQYELKDRREKSAQREGFNSSDVMYLITPDRFANGNLKNDHYEELGDVLNREDNQDRHGGDIQGVIDHLDYIQEMGFTAIWLNPVLINRMPRTSYHGYATTDYYKIDPRYGTLEDYILLSKEAKKRGIKLIMDQIMNHCGSEHWWMKDMPDKNWINSKEEYQITNHRRTVINDPYAAQSDKDKFEKGWFVDAMPDLNGDHPLLRDNLIQNSIWWVEVADLGGIRHDTHPYPGAAFMSAYTCSIMDEYPNFNIVGEEWSLNPIIVSKWQRGNEQTKNLNSCLPSVMDFPLQDVLVKSLIQEEAWNTGLNNLYELIACDDVYPDPNNLVIFPDNHDMDRYYTQLNEDFELYKIGLTYLATTRGIPQIYYGTEILMANPLSHDHGEIRTDFPGGWPNDEVNGFTGNKLSPKAQEAQDFMKTLLNFRKDCPTIHTGNMMHYAPDNGLYVYFRYNENQKIMVIINKGTEARKINPLDYPEMDFSNKKGLDVLTNGTISFENLEILAKESVIIQID